MSAAEILHLVPGRSEGDRSGCLRTEAEARTFIGATSEHSQFPGVCAFISKGSERHRGDWAIDRDRAVMAMDSLRTVTPSIIKQGEECEERELQLVSFWLCSCFV